MEYDQDRRPHKMGSSQEEEEREKFKALVELCVRKIRDQIGHRPANFELAIKAYECLN